MFLVVGEELSILYDFFIKYKYPVEWVKNGDISEKNQDISLIFFFLNVRRRNDCRCIGTFKEQFPSSGIIVIAEIPDVDIMKIALTIGIMDYLHTPINMHNFRSCLSIYLQKIKQKELVSDFQSRMNIVGDSIGIKKCMEIALKAGNTSYPVLLLGENGSGKEVLADFLHNNSMQKHFHLIKLNCAAIPENIAESELFGFEKGAFTGAYTQSIGKLEQANKGTLFLDEIADLSMSMQAKLLRAVESKTFYRVGGKKEVKSEFRLICATNRNIKKMVVNGEFREDLFHRINTIIISTPPLRERRDDIPLLLKHFHRLFSDNHIYSFKSIDDSFMRFLLSYHWPGNIRELQNFIASALIFSVQRTITEKETLKFLHLRKSPKAEPEYDLSQVERNHSHDNIILLETIERMHIEKVLAMKNGNKKKTAAALGITERTLYNRLKKFKFID